MASEVFDIYKCRDCGFQFTKKAEDQSTFVNCTDTQKEEQDSFLCKIYDFAHRIMLKRKASLIKKLTMLRSGKILDYGARDNDFARTMAHKGWNATIVKREDWNCKEAEKDEKINKITENEIHSLKKESFDIITAWHVIEHTEDFDEFMKTSKKLLDENGILILAAPNSASYDAENYREHWAAYNAPHHLWHFNSSTMMQLGGKHGFILERRFPMPIDGFYISILSEKREGRKLPVIRGIWNGFLGWIASCDKCSASSSIIYVFRKRR